MKFRGKAFQIALKPRVDVDGFWTWPSLMSVCPPCEGVREWTRWWTVGLIYGNAERDDRDYNEHLPRIFHLLFNIAIIFDNVKIVKKK